MSSLPLPMTPQNAPRAEQLFHADLNATNRRVERMFMWLLLLEWLGGIFAALVISPLAWDGIDSYIHNHVYAAVYLGGLIISFPLLVAWFLPGTVWSRHAIAAGQLLYSSLLIHLTGGRLETHFHVFGSLAFLAMFRDWRVLITASVIVAADHFFRGIYAPFSVYNSLTVSPWRWLEHVGWVAFEDSVLIFAIRQSLFEMRAIATRQTALEEASTRAESADRAKGAFLAQMSHEIRTPMTAILGYADMMAMEGEKAEAVQAIRRNGRHLLTVLDDILDLSKIEADQLRILKTPTDVIELLRDVQHLMNPRASQRGITLSLELQNIPPALITDAVRLRQIVLNFTSNAIKFTAKGHVRIEASFVAGEAPAGTLSIRVADSGIGLTQEQQDRLFQAFSQADDQHHRKYGGTGLGLVISKRLAMLMGGDVEVESELGVGSTFCVRVPVETTDEPAAETEAPEPETKPVEQPRALATAGVGKRVLVVDDAADNRRLLRRLLVLGGYEVDLADDGSTGITAARAAINDGRPYNVIIMDILMPNVDGYEATRKIRESGHEGIILALTGNASPAEEEKCRLAGCDDYLTKPFDCEMLLHRIQHALAPKSHFTASH